MVRQPALRSVVAALALPLLLSTPSGARAQQKLLTIDDLYDPERKVEFSRGLRVDVSGRPPTDLVWISDTHYLWARRDAAGEEAELLKIEAMTGQSEPFFDAARMEGALARLPGITREEARRLSRQRQYVMNPQRTATLLTVAGDLHYYEFGADRARRLTVAPGDEQEVSFSPDGTLVAFVRDSNLYLIDLETGRERPLTTDGTSQFLNGRLDWLYQEEVYGRGNFRAYWWSPDSSRIAYLQLDERPVPEFTVLDHLPYRLEVETWDYPKAGDPNPVARLGIVRVAGGPPVWVDTDVYAPVQLLIVDVDWTPDSQSVVFQVQDREQTWLDLKLADPASGQAKTVLRETTRAWVNRNGNPHWLKDGAFLWLSERSGWKHLYHYRPDGTLVRQVTDGPWEVRTLHGIDEAAGWIYFSGTERSHLGSDVYRVKLDGSGLARVSQAEGTHSAAFSPSVVLYLDAWSAATTPPQVRLHRADGTDVRVVDENRVPALTQYRLGRVEFHQVKARDGFVLEALMIKPPDFDPTRKYPVYQLTYGGPHAPRVSNQWGGTTYMFHQLLAQRGIIVWMCDNRTASGKGAVSTWPLYKNLGELELRDIEDGLAWLKRQPYVDDARIGLSGWSYGGFMVSYALTHSKSFAMGIAGGSVTDWRAYDTIYTERYMLMPQNNAEGYRKSAPRFAAKNLHGRLLLIHGTMDDNVHMQNTLQFAYELQKAGKPFELMLYPKSRHGVTDPHLVKHMQTLMLDFIVRTLKPTGAAETAPTKTESSGSEHLR